VIDSTLKAALPPVVNPELPVIAPAVGVLVSTVDRAEGTQAVVNVDSTLPSVVFALHGCCCARGLPRPHKVEFDARWGHMHTASPSSTAQWTRA